MGRESRSCTDRWTSAETDADVALESDVVAAGELEGVEVRNEDLLDTVVPPVAEDVRIGGAAVFVRHQVVDLLAVLDGLGVAVPRESAVDICKNGSRQITMSASSCTN